jgi:hypothetical protein
MAMDVSEWVCEWRLAGAPSFGVGPYMSNLGTSTGVSRHDAVANPAQW